MTFNKALNPLIAALKDELIIQKLKLELLLKPQGLTITISTIITYPTVKVLEKKEYYKEELKGLYTPDLILKELGVRKKFTSIFTAFGSIWRLNAHFTHCNVQHIVLTQVRHTAAFNNTVQLIAHLQPLGQIALNIQLIYNALLAHFVHFAYFK